MGRSFDIRLLTGSTVAYAFNAFAPALAFMRATKADAVVVEFDVEVETMDFCDAVKASQGSRRLFGNQLRASATRSNTASQLRRTWFIPPAPSIDERPERGSPSATLPGHRNEGKP